MSRIQKLKIKGVRSFPEDAPATIELFSPLTLVVGQNGTGKTTLIEALKYAATGSLPPNSKNGAFVHDPRFSREAETKAHVMMKFVSCSGQELVLLRAMAQSSGRAKSETKTLESSLWEVSGKEKRLICNKLGSLDAEVPMLLGTTSAVLENVIFCHQEESTWPLAEPAIFKKKMDGIFSSARFVKALEALKALKKEKNVDIKVLDAQFAAVQHSVAAKRKLLQRIARVDERVAQHAATAHEKTEKMEKARQVLRERETEHEHALGLLREKERFESELSGLSSKTLLLAQPVEELAALLATLQQRLTHEDTQEIEKAVSVLEGQAVLLQDKIEMFAALKRQRDTSRKEIEHLAEEVTATATKGAEYLKKEVLALNRARSEVEGLSAGAEEVVGQSAYLASLLGQIQPDPGRPLEPSLAQLQGACNAYSALTGLAEMAVDEDILLCHRTMAEDMEGLGALKEKSSALCERIGAINGHAQKNASSEEAILKDLARHRARSGAVYERRVFAADKARVRQGIDRCQQEIARALELGGKYKEKEFLQKEIAQKEAELAYTVHPTEAQSTPRGEMLHVLERLRKEAQTKIVYLEERLQQSTAQQQRYIEDKTAKRAAAMAHALLEEAKAKRIEEILKNITSELITDKGAITKTELLQRLKEHRKVSLCTENSQSTPALHRKLGGFSASEEIYTAFKNRAEESCPFCKGALSAGATKGHLQKIDAILEQIKQRKQALEEELGEERAKEAYAQRQSLQKALLNEVAALFHPLLPEQQSLQEDVPLEEWSILLKTAQHSDASLEELRQKYLYIEGLREREESIVLPPSTYQDLLVQYKEKQAALHELEHLEEEEQKKLLEHEKETDRSLQRVKELENLLEARHRYDTEAVSFEAEKANLAHTYQGVCRELSEKQRRIEELKTREKERRAVKSELKLLAQHSTSLPLLQGTQARISSLQEQIEAHNQVTYTEEDRKKEEELTRTQAQVRGEKEVLALKLASLSTAQARAQTIKDSIRALALKQQIVQCGVTQDTVQDIKSEIKALELRVAEEQQGLSETAGEVHTLARQKQEDEKDLQEYADVEEQELSMFITIKVAKESISDLDKYQKGLEASIVRYHSEKLAEVNAIIKEIWSMTYKGGDIEKIRIVSKLDKTYMVVMDKEGVEIEMRGRVSAGQKVLASIVVRLALAEAFSNNCGLLSLDEPTTNLDKENIGGLAKALSAIINARRAEGSFQLLVITHDEDFVRELLKSGSTEYFYRISRDDQLVPHIGRLSIYDV
ncbi:DNA repair protein RAD5 [Nematocida displodere]|uniref:DNA repair protein RAD5 n=1 Tax=Nematocida displodere TaxID=1805483 RepID=A0A177EAM6_9MICR|nr:DNA repair protein RAD5 [Nematocida displodere]